MRATAPAPAMVSNMVLPLEGLGRITLEPAPGLPNYRLITHKTGYISQVYVKIITSGECERTDVRNENTYSINWLSK